MKKILTTISGERIGALALILVIVTGAFLFGVSKYIDFRLDRLVVQIEDQSFQKEQDYRKSLENLQALLLSTASSLQGVLTQEQQKNNNLQKDFENITSTVSSLEKLSTTDPELLRKYSKVYFLNEHYVKNEVRPRSI